jgi:hypothetical protein
MSAKGEEVREEETEESIRGRGGVAAEPKLRPEMFRK